MFQIQISDILHHSIASFVSPQDSSSKNCQDRNQTTAHTEISTTRSLHKAYLRIRKSTQHAHASKQVSKTPSRRSCSPLTRPLPIPCPTSSRHCMRACEYQTPTLEPSIYSAGRTRACICSGRASTYIHTCSNEQGKNGCKGLP